MANFASSNWIDAHAHLTDPRFMEGDGGVDRVLNEAAAAGITRFVLGGIEPAEWEKQKRLAARFPDRIFPAFGLHPWWVAAHTREESESGLKCLEAEAMASPRTMIAIGETGLDFHPRFAEETRSGQEAAFRAHIGLAMKTGLPLVLHIVRAHSRALEILSEELNGGEASKTLSGIVHSFSGDLSIARNYLKMGLVPSISAPVLSREKGSAYKALARTVRELGPEEFVLETDAPDQPPNGVEGLNQPHYLLQTADRIANLRREGRELVLNRSRDVICRIFL